MEHTLLDYYRAIDDASQKMLQAAQSENWDQVVDFSETEHPSGMGQALQLMYARTMTTE